MPTLTIISHTEHYENSDGSIVGLGSTVTEINHLLEIFETITHVAMLHGSNPPKSALPYKSKAISFIALPAVGGPNFKDKIAIIRNIPKILHIIHNEIKKTDYYQFRAPTGIGIFVIPYLILFPKKKGWFKYAGNWQQKNPPVAYRFQKYLLTKQRQIVTINGHWNKQPKNCLSFENPCLTVQEVLEGRTIAGHKEKLKDGIHICFVGRLEKAKGLDLLIEAIGSLTNYEKKQIQMVHIVGSGKKKEFYLEKAKLTNVRFEFYDFLPRDKVHTIYKRSHAIILPSASEGFPKVISEAMNYGCLPIVSNISSIGHYIIDGENGFLMDFVDEFGVKSALLRFLTLSKNNFNQMVSIKTNTLQKFTYSYYNKRIKTEILI